MVIAPELLQQIASQAEEADWNGALGAVLEKPTAANIHDLTTFPGRLEQMQGMVADHGYEPGQVKRNARDAVELAGLLNRGHVKTALQYLGERRAGLRKANESTEVTDAMRRDLLSGEPARIERVKGMAGLVLASSTHPEDLPLTLHAAGFGKVPGVKLRPAETDVSASAERTPDSTPDGEMA